MATVSYRLEDLKKAIVGIGYVGENDHMHVLIDCKEVFDEYPNAVPTMAIVPPVGEGYPKAVTRNGDVVEWLVKDSDVTVEGDGEFQLSFTEGEIIRKSVNARFRVKRSISGSGSAPSGVQDWLTDANEKLAEVEQATQDAEAAASHQPYIGIDGYWYTWNGEEFVKNVKAQGEKGDPGDPGSPGDPTQLIDDTAGKGQTGKTWSADKLDETTGQLLTAIDGIGDFVGDTDTDLGSHSDKVISEYVNMTPKSVTEGNVALTITKSHITANGVCNETRLKELQTGIELAAGDYVFSIGSLITSSGYQIQLLDSNENFIKVFSSSDADAEYPFTLASAKTLKIRLVVYTGNTIDDSNELSLTHTVVITGDNTLAYVAKKTEDLIGDLNADLGKRENTETTEYANMTPKTVTEGHVDLTITKNHITSSGTCNETRLRILQDDIAAPAGKYVFSIGEPIKSTGYQLQIQNKTDNETIIGFSSSSGIFENTFTLEAAKTLQIRVLVLSGNVINDSNDISLQRVVEEIVDNTLVSIAKEVTGGHLKGKKILAFGDSIWGDDRTNGIADFLKAYSGATVYNAGIGGTRITGDRSQYEVPKFIPFDGVTLINAFLTNTWTDQDAWASEVWDYVSTSTLPMLKSLDIKDIDIVILAYGTNDFSAPRTISAVASAFLSAVSALLTANPKLRIICIVPPWRMFESGTVDGDTYENGNGDTLQEFDTGIEAEIKAKHIEVLNMLERCPWRAETKGYYMDSDATHPNKYGNQVYAHIVNGKLKTMY